MISDKSLRGICMRIKLVLLTMAALGALAITGAGCGVRQFNGKIRNTANPPQHTLDAPFYAAGQVGSSAQTPVNQMSPTGGAASCSSGVGRPCARMRASVGVPMQFDVNPNISRGISTDPLIGHAAGPYAGTAQAHPTKGVAGRVNSGAGGTRHDSELQNRDLKIMDRLPQ